MEGESFQSKLDSKPSSPLMVPGTNNSFHTLQAKQKNITNSSSPRRLVQDVMEKTQYSQERQATGQAHQAGGCCPLGSRRRRGDRWGEMAFATVNSASRSTQGQAFIWMYVPISLH